MPGFPFPISGRVFDTDGVTALSGVRVTVRNERTSETTNTTTLSNGDYGLHAANFASGYADKDLVTVFVIYSNAEDFEERTINIGEGGILDLDLTLVEVPASDQLRYYTVQEFFDFHGLEANHENAPLTKTVVLAGVMAEEEIDQMCGTRFSDGQFEIEVDNADATTGWSGSTDAVAIAVSTDDADYKTKTGGLDLGKSGTTEAFFHYVKSSLTQRSFLDRYIVFWVKIDSLSGLRTVDNGSAIQVRYGTDSGNYYQRSWYYDELTTGWNLFYFKKGDREVTTSGGPTDSNMGYFQIRFDTAATSTTFTAGTVVLDNLFLVHKDHFVDEKIDTRDDFTRDYYLSKLPVERLLQVKINRADEGFTQVFDEVTEVDNEIKVNKKTGLVRLIDVTASVGDATRIFPAEGINQVQAVYLFGRDFVPADIKKLAIVMTARDLVKSTASKALFAGRNEFNASTYEILDKQIDRILSRYRNLNIVNT